MKSKFINPFTDFGFKRIFGEEMSKDCLIKFLNDLLEGERVITDLTFLDKEQQPNTAEGRRLIYDIYCKTDADEYVIVEMQYKEQKYFKERALYYASSAIAKQGERGREWQYNIAAVYGVFFMNFTLPDADPNDHRFRIDVELADRDTGRQFSDKLRLIFMPLKNFEKEEDECKTNFERWLYVLKNMNKLERMPFKAQLAVLEKLEQIASVASLTKQEALEYERTLNDYRTAEATWEFAKEKGIAEKAMETARTMKQRNYPIDEIMAITGLSREEIEQV